MKWMQRRLAMGVALVGLVHGCGSGSTTKSPALDTTPPTISSTSPADAATAVALDAQVAIGFSEAIDPASVTATSVAWKDAAGATVAYTPSFDASTLVLTLAPTSPLANYTQYTVDVTTDVKDVAGNHLAAAKTIHFTTADAVGPTAPAAPTDAGSYTRAGVVFNWTEPTDAGTGVASYVLQIASSAAGTPVVFEQNVGNLRTYTFTGTDGQHLYARVRAVDAAGNEGPWSAFSDGIVVDTVAPSITSTTPADTALDVARSGQVRIAFSESTIDLSTVTATSVVFTDASSAPVTYYASLDGTTLVLAPTSPSRLANLTGYTVQVTTAVADLAGNHLATGRTFSFTTADDVPPTPVAAPTDAGDWSAASVAFSWSAATDDGSGVAGYVLRVTTDAAGTQVVYEHDVGNVTTYTYGGTDGQQLFAQVRAVDAAGNFAEWSQLSDGIQVDATAPTTPAAPTSGAYATTTTTHFAWTAATESGSGLAEYVVEIASAADPLAVLDTAIVTSGTTYDYDSSLAAEGALLYARIAAQDAVGNSSDWSPWSAAVMVDTLAPSKVAAPTDAGTYSKTTSLHFTWSAASDGGGSGVKEYAVDVSTGATPGTVVHTATASGTSYDYTAADGEKVYVRVQAVDFASHTAAMSDWSDGILVDTTNPGTPGAVTHSGTTSAAQVVFNWTAATDGGTAASGIAKYELEIVVNGGTPAITDVGNVLTYTVTAANGDTVTARARAVDRAGNTGSFGTGSGTITVDAVAPGAPGTPTDAGAWTTGSPVFSWTGATDNLSGIGSYVVEVATADDGTGILVTQNTGSLRTYTFDTTGLAEGTRLYAHAAAIDKVGNQGSFSSWSDGIGLDLNPPTAPGTPQDGGAGTSSTTVHFSWAQATDAASGVKQYTLEVASDPSGTPVVGTVTVTGTSTDFTYGASLPVTLYAHVRATDNVSHTGDYSSFSDGITIQNDVPQAPGTPSAAAYSTDGMLAFTWTAPSAGTTPSGYVLEVGTTVGGNDVVAGKSVSGTSDTVDASALPNGRTYYARVAGKAPSNGTPGPWSDSSAGIMVDKTPPTAPTNVGHQGATAPAQVVITWDAASDAESGIATYDVEVTTNSTVTATGIVGTSYTYDASGYNGTLTARVRAVDKAGLTGDWSAPSSGVTVDSTAPWVTQTSPDSTWTRPVPTNIDFSVHFSEPMDHASVEAAFSLTVWGTKLPRYEFHWSGDQDVVVVPDVAAPGITNADVLPDDAPVTLAVSAGAKDLAGNPLVAYSTSFTTADETAPSVVSAKVGADDIRLAAVSAATLADTGLVLTFNEPMEPTGGNVDLRGQSMDAWASFNESTITAASGDGANVTYTYSGGGAPPIAVGAIVTVKGMMPAEYDVTGATVLSAGGNTFTVAGTATSSVTNYGWVSYAVSNGLSIAWTGPTTLVVKLANGQSVAPGADGTLEVHVGDVAGNGVDLELPLQVAGDPGVDQTPPYVVSSAPASGEAMARNRVIVIGLSEPVLASAASLVQVTGAGIGTNDFQITYDDDQMGPMIRLVPWRALPPGLAFRVTIPEGITDLAGNPMAAPVDIVLATDSSDDTSAPVLYESLPAASAIIADVWSIGTAFADGTTGDLEAIDSDTLTPSSIAVRNEDTGLLVRGWRYEHRTGSPFVRWMPPAQGGLGTGSDWAHVVSVVASGSVATYTLDEQIPSTLTIGSPVSVWLSGADQVFNLWNATVTNIDGDQFEVAWSQADGVSSANPSGQATWPVQRDYTVDLVAGITDAFGNAYAGDSFTFTVAPPPTNRYPVLEDLESLRVTVSASPAGQSLSLDARVKDADQGSLTATLYGVATGGTNVSLLTLPVTLNGGSQSVGNGDHGGPPMSNDPPALAANFTAPAMVTFPFDLFDGHHHTTYFRQAFVWTPDSVPQYDSIVDGGTPKATDPARPIVLTSRTAPVLNWKNVDVANADLLMTYVVDYAAVGKGPGAQGFMQIAPMSAHATALTPVLPATPSAYLWTPVQMKVDGGGDLAGQGWALDLGNVSRATFVVGPDNSLLAGQPYTMANLGLVVKGDGSGLEDLWDSTGSALTEGVASGIDPVFVNYFMLDQSGNPMATSYGAPPLLYGYDGTRGEIMITQPGHDSPVQVPGHGFAVRSGQMLMTAQGGPATVPYINIAAKRFQTSGWTSSPFTGDVVFVEADLGHGSSGLTDFHASLGTATLDGLNVTTTECVEPASTCTPGPATSYTLGDDGLMTMMVGPDPAYDWGSGYIGGAAGNEIVPIARTMNDPNNPLVSFVFAARAYQWTGSEDDTFLHDWFQFVRIEAKRDGSDVGSAASYYGSMSFDAQGGIDMYATGSTGPVTGHDTYAVDATNHEVVIGGETVCRAAANLRTLVCIDVGSADKLAVTILAH